MIKIIPCTLKDITNHSDHFIATIGEYLTSLDQKPEKVFRSFKDQSIDMLNKREFLKGQRMRRRMKERKEGKISLKKKAQLGEKGRESRREFFPAVK